jgi:histidinol-phosphate aminotransferase
MEVFGMIHSRKPVARPAVERMQPYNPGKPIWEVEEEFGISQVVKLASNENPLGPSPKAMAAFIACAADMHRYPDAQSARLKQAISRSHDIELSQIITGNGADELITLISETYLNEGDEIIVPAPSFTEYEFGAKLMGACTIKVCLRDGFSYDAEAILTAVTERTKIVYLCSPHNPTGVYMDKKTLGWLIDRLPASVLTVIDAAYWHYATAPDYTNGMEFIRQDRSVIVLQTFSKVYGLAGIRAGFAVTTPEIASDLNRCKEPFNVNAMAQAAAAAALDDTGHVERSVAANTAGRIQL